MVLKVTRLRTRGFTCRCAPFADPFCGGCERLFKRPPGFLFKTSLDEFFWEACALPFDPIFENAARMVAGGSPASADCGYMPRSAILIEDASRSLPTI